MWGEPVAIFVYLVMGLLLLAMIVGALRTPENQSDGDALADETEQPSETGAAR